MKNHRSLTDRKEDETHGKKSKGHDGTGLAQLTRNAARELHPDFSPDGRKIAFVSERDFQPGIYTMNADGTKQKKRSRGPATVFQFPSWSPDGERIAFNTNQDGPDEIHSMRADGSAQKRLTKNGAPDDDAPVFSPNGKKIAFSTNRDGNFEIYATNRDGTGQTNLTDDPAGDFTPDWQPLERRRWEKRERRTSRARGGRLPAAEAPDRAT